MIRATSPPDGACRQVDAGLGGLFDLGGDRLGKDFKFTSESVTKGHPDKVADQISDAILDKILAQDPTARVAAETVVTTGLALVAG